MTRGYVSTPRVTQAVMIDQKLNRRLTGQVTWIGGDPENEVEALLKELAETHDLYATDDGFLYLEE